MNTQGSVKTRYISRARYEALGVLVKMFNRKRLDEAGDLPALYVCHLARTFEAAMKHGPTRSRVYFIREAEQYIECIYPRRIKYKPVPESEE